MATFKRILASVFLAAGVLLVFAGLTVSLGLTPSGILASLAAVAALLYAGGVWFGVGGSPVPGTYRLPILVFDRIGHIIGGEGAGQLVTSQFPEFLRPEIDRRCRAALGGISQRFPAVHNGRMVVFDAFPVRAADGAIVYGILVTSDAEPAAIAASL